VQISHLIAPNLFHFDSMAMLHHAQDLAASPPLLYKFIVGRRGASPIFLCRLGTSMRLTKSNFQEAMCNTANGAGAERAQSILRNVLFLHRERVLRQAGNLVEYEAYESHTSAAH
jgi:hypothetical protein